MLAKYTLQLLERQSEQERKGNDGKGRRRSDVCGERRSSDYRKTAEE